MVDMKLAAQKGVFAALDVPALQALTPVFQHVPDGQDPPHTIIGEFTAAPVGGKDGGFDEIEFEVRTVVRAAGTEFLRPAMNKARELLEDQDLGTVDGVALSPPEFLSDEDEKPEDGITYEGVQRFKLFAQPSD